MLKLDVLRELEFLQFRMSKMVLWVTITSIFTKLVGGGFGNLWSIRTRHLTPFTTKKILLVMCGIDLANQNKRKVDKTKGYLHNLLFRYIVFIFK